MIRHFPALALVLATLLSGGCLKARQVITLKPDGSGTMEVKYAVDEDAVTQISGLIRLKQQMLEMAGQAYPAGPSEELMDVFLTPSEQEIRGRLKRYEKNGVKIEKLAIDTKGGARQVELLTSFTSIGEVARTDFFMESGVSLLENEDGSYTFKRIGRTQQDDTMGVINDPTMAQALSPLLKGFNVTIAMVVPGKIMKTTGTKTTDTSAEWNFDYDKSPTAIASIQKQELSVQFDGKGASLPIIRSR